MTNPLIKTGMSRFLWEYFPRLKQSRAWRPTQEDGIHT